MTTAKERRPVYMDHNATTPVLPDVVEAMLPFLTREFGNASSTTHGYGREAARAVESARESVARLVGARQPGEIVFTAGATESDNLALRGLVAAAPRGRRHIITCAIEHEAVLETCQTLAHEGCEITVLPVDRHGLVDPAAVGASIRPETLAVSIMMANNEIGTIQPLADIGRICRQSGVAFHSDAVQAAGRVPIDVEALGLDLASVTAHKMYGPKGVGALYVREGLALAPLLAGGGQERGRRSGTLNVPGIVGFGHAADIVLADLDAEAERQRGLRDRLWDELVRRIPGVRLNGHPSLRLPNTLNVAFDGIEAESLLMAVRNAAALSAGSACASGSGKGSYVIEAIGKDREGGSGSRSSIRFGLGRGNETSHVDLIVESLEFAVGRLRAMAPADTRPIGQDS